MPVVRNPSWINVLFCIGAAILAMNLIGCASVGADRLRAGRTDYNAAIKDTDVDQLLLNIVRLRFSDKPYFLEIASISATTEVGGSFGATQEKGLGAGISMFERPNIVYVPVTGEQFVQQLLEPIDLHTLIRLRGAGWEIDDIFRVFANYINDVPNAPTGAGSTPEGVPEFSEFLEVIEAIDELEDAGMLFLAVSSDNANELVMGVTTAGRNTDHFRDLVRLLDLDENTQRYRIRLGVLKTTRGEIVVETRPILSAMFYLGQSIELPRDVLDAGIVHSGDADDAVGEPFDWNEVLQQLIRIKSSAQEPTNAYSAVQYGDYWYYIANDDVNSKETLTMLGVVLSLKAGGSPTDRPLLTLPVGGG